MTWILLALVEVRNVPGYHLHSLGHMNVPSNTLSSHDQDAVSLIRLALFHLNLITSLYETAYGSSPGTDRKLRIKTDDLARWFANRMFRIKTGM